MTVPFWSTTLTMSPFTPVPRNPGVVSLVVVPVGGPLMAGAAGAVVSTVKLNPVLAAEIFPAVSVAVTVAECELAARTGVVML